MKVCLIIPPYVMEGRKNKGVLPNKAMFPVGPLVVCEIIRNKGHQIEALDLVFERDWSEQLAKISQPDLVLLSCHTVRNISSCKAILQWINEHLSIQPRIVLGGNVCTELTHKDFDQLGLKVDAVVRGYAHSSDVVDLILEREVKGDILAIAEKNSLGLMPLPALNVLSKKVHAKYLRASEGRYPMIGHGFGCQWSCGYCSAKMKSGWSERNKENVEAELKEASRLGYKEIWCVDNIIFVDWEHTMWFDRKVKQLGMTWSAMTRPELVCKMKEKFLLGTLVSLSSLAMGVETVSEESLRSLHRGSTTLYLETCIQAFDIIRSIGIDTVAFVMLDLPGSTEDVFFATLNMLQNSLRPTSVSWSYYNPLAKEVLKDRNPKEYGFYKWPIGLSAVRHERVVQQAMILSGIYWRGWTLQSDNLFYENEAEFGVNFVQGTISQKKTARSPIGDGWYVWEETTN